MTRSTSLALVLALALALAAPAARSDDAPAGALDGRAFAVSLKVVEGQAKETPDTLTFREGTFDSSACQPLGFGAAVYTATQDGEAVTFDATSTSATHGTNVWSGRVEGDRISGTLDWTKDGKTIRYGFEGKAKGA